MLDKLFLIEFFIIDFFFILLFKIGGFFKSLSFETSSVAKVTDVLF